MEAATPDRHERRAWAVVGLFIVTLIVGLALLVAFDTDVQTVDAKELVQRKDDAREFFAGDYLFVFLYAVLSPIALWRFGTTVEGRARRWTWLAALLLAAAGVFDATENALLLSATGSVSEGAVDAAHVVAIPKTVLFLGGAVLTIAANVRAIRLLREHGSLIRTGSA